MTHKLAVALFAGMSVVALGSQAGTPLWNDMPESIDGSLGFQTPAPPPVAELPLRSGGALAFVDTGDGTIGTGELTVRAAPIVSVAMVARFRATPLELFLAAAPPGTRAPALLYDDHYAYQRRSGWPSRPPRDLSGELAKLDLDDPGVEPFECDSMGYNWRQQWRATFEELTDHRASAFIHQLQPELEYRFYPGGYYNADGSITGGFNAVTYLGACNGDEYTALPLRVERRIAYQTPDGQVSSWTGIQDISLNNQEKYTFHSNVPASFRGYVSADVQLLHFGAAVAYNKSMPKRSTF